MARTNTIEGILDGRGCMEWQGIHNHKGYGQVKLKGTSFQVHRTFKKVVYRIFWESV